MVKKNTLNNYTLENVRRSREYQAILTDLTIEGVVPLDVAETLLGYEIPDYLKSPSGKSVERKPAAAPSKKKEKDTAKAEEKDSLFKEE